MSVPFVVEMSRDAMAPALQPRKRLSRRVSIA
jgi:hypothetical protein